MTSSTNGTNATAGTVYVIDDDPQILEMLRDMIEPGGNEARCFADATSFLQAYPGPQPRECLLCDLRLPGMSGLQLQHHLADAGAGIPIIFMTGFAEVEVAVEAMKRGAFDFIQKPFANQTHLDRINDALDESQRRFVRSRHDSTLAARLACLTPQERRIADHVAAGQSSPAIARELGLSQRTVENHRAHIMDKLRVRSTAELIRLMIDVTPRPQGG